MWKIAILLIGILCQLVSWLNACPSIESKTFSRVPSCDTTLEDDHLQVQCYFHAWSSAASFAIGVITTFNTPQPFAFDDRSNSREECLQMTHGRLKTITQPEVQQYMVKSNKLDAPPFLMRSFMAIKNVDFDFKFESDEVVGKISYNPGCIRDKRQSNSPIVINNLNISECVSEVNVVDAIAAPAKSFTDFGRLDVQSPNLLTLLVRSIDMIWLDKYRGTVRNVTLTLQGSFDKPNFAKEAIAMLMEKQIEALHLPNNHFETIGNDDLPALPTLKTLDFTNCRLRSIEPLAFQSMTNLVHLNLAGNQFQHIPHALTPLIKLEILNMGSNKIVNVPKTDLNIYISYVSMYTQFPRLQSLDLSNNSIDMLSPYSLSNDMDDHPRLLNLSGNKIQAWSEPMLKVVSPNRLEIDVTRNKISTVTPAMVTDFSMLNHVYLSGNPFDCDSCHLSVFQEWLSTNGTPNDHDSDPYKCSSPTESAGLDVIKVRIDTEKAPCSSAASGKHGIWTSSHFCNILMMLYLCMNVLSINSGHSTN